ncbi:MAG: DUF1761 domain-containing protein, partial [Novosphingobium sp.]
AVGLVWYGPLFGGAPLFGRVSGGDKAAARGPITSIVGAIVFQALPALMLGHLFARVGPETLAAKPWLYWMQSGGVALAFIVPALFVSYSRHRLAMREALVDAGFWVVVYLATGTVFWALA